MRPSMAMSVVETKKPEESNNPALRVTCREVYDMMQERPFPIMTTTDVADYFDVSRPTANERLGKLQNDGWIRREDMNRRTRVWYIPERLEVKR